MYELIQVGEWTYYIKISNKVAILLYITDKIIKNY